MIPCYGELPCSGPRLAHTPDLLCRAMHVEQDGTSERPQYTNSERALRVHGGLLFRCIRELTQVERFWTGALLGRIPRTSSHTSWIESALQSQSTFFVVTLLVLNPHVAYMNVVSSNLITRFQRPGTAWCRALPLDGQVFARQRFPRRHRSRKIALGLFVFCMYLPSKVT